ncbi:MAG: cellulose biosynthesis protein BcsS [Proteobacteria bacterium]|nr:cellulose biosynthesis protein BcsS [Pseudomonadota bacterium]
MRVAGCLAATIAVATLSAERGHADAGGDSVGAQHLLLFSGGDFWRNGKFTHGGLLWSPDGLERTGFTLKALIGAGTYRYRSGAGDIAATQYLAALMPGWRYKINRVEITIFGGIDAQHHRPSPADPGNRLSGSHLGVRAGADMWWEPTAASMVAVAASLSTIGASHWARAAYGTRVFDRLYVGPEALAIGDTTYRQFRLGLHATALRSGPFEWSAGVGWATDSSKRSGAYGHIGLLTRR